MNLNAQWVVGFVDGEGCFHIGVSKHPEMSMGVQVLPEFTVVQHERDVKILQALKRFFGCGVVRSNHGDQMAFRVRKLEHLNEIIIPFFMKHSLKTIKNVEFIKFRKALNLVNQRKHLEEDGLKEIQQISSMMNRKQRLR